MRALKLAQREPPQQASPILNGLVSPVKAEQDQRLEVEEARSAAFLAICEIGKALHRGQPADHLLGGSDSSHRAVDGARRMSMAPTGATTHFPFIKQTCVY